MSLDRCRETGLRNYEGERERVRVAGYNPMLPPLLRSDVGAEHFICPPAVSAEHDAYFVLCRIHTLP
jgi:hypothetical protein